MRDWLEETSISESCGSESRVADEVDNSDQIQKLS